MRNLAFLLLVCPCFALGQVPQIRSGATVYIEPMGGYGAYLAAALIKKHVPLEMVADRAKAEYIIESTFSHDAPSVPGVVIDNSTTVNEGDTSPNQQAWNQGWALGQQRAAARRALGYSSASIAVLDAKSSQIVFAHSAGKGGGNQLQKTAEDCAKHLKEFIEKQEKISRSQNLVQPIPPRS